MKLQIALRFLVLFAAIVASGMMNDGSDPAPRRDPDSSSSQCTTEVKAEGVEVAAGGYEVGQMQA